MRNADADESANAGIICDLGAGPSTSTGNELSISGNNVIDKSDVACQTDVDEMEILVRLFRQSLELINFLQIVQRSSN